MLWRTYLLNRLVGQRDIIYMIGRHPVVYAKVVIQYIALFAFLFFLWKVVGLWLPDKMGNLIFGGVVAVCYLAGIFMILRSYFDVIVATREHLYIVLWDSFFKYRIKVLTRPTIQDISFVPASGLSVMWDDSHVSIATEQDETIVFHNVYEADRVVANLYDIRQDYINRHREENEDEEEDQDHIADDEKFKVLVETLGEVIVDYMNKKDG